MVGHPPLVHRYVSRGPAPTRWRGGSPSRPDPPSGARWRSRRASAGRSAFGPTSGRLTRPQRALHAQVPVGLAEPPGQPGEVEVRRRAHVEAMRDPTTVGLDPEARVVQPACQREVGHEAVAAHDHPGESDARHDDDACPLGDDRDRAAAGDELDVAVEGLSHRRDAAGEGLVEVDACAGVPDVGGHEPVAAVWARPQVIDPGGILRHPSQASPGCDALVDVRHRQVRTRQRSRVIARILIEEIPMEGGP
jgi:hypothetical protein